MECCCCETPKIKLNVKIPECRCGGHIALKDTLYNTIKSAPNCKCVQMFLGGPTTYECRTISEQDKRQTSEYCQQHDKTFYVHCPYVANLAKHDMEAVTKSVKVISKELNAVKSLPGACVLHVGKVGTIENVAQRINEIQAAGDLPLSSHERVPFHLLLEIAAGQGTELGRSWEEIRHLYEALDYTRVGLCVDTQHAFASGMCSFQTHEDVVKLFDAANSISYKGISMLHLNDSKKEFGSKVDRHVALKTGYIWSKSDEGLRSLLEISKDCCIDMISETNDPLGDALLVQTYLE